MPSCETCCITRPSAALFERGPEHQDDRRRDRHPHDHDAEDRGKMESIGMILPLVTHTSYKGGMSFQPPT